MLKTFPTIIIFQYLCRNLLNMSTAVVLENHSPSISIIQVKVASAESFPGGTLLSVHDL